MDAFGENERDDTEGQDGRIHPMSGGAEVETAGARAAAAAAAAAAEEAADTRVVLRRPGATRTDRRGRALNTKGVGVVEGRQDREKKRRRRRREVMGERQGGRKRERVRERKKSRRRRFNVKGGKNA